MRKIKLQWLLVFTIIMAIAMQLQWNMENKKVQKGIIALELAKTSKEAVEITKDWNIPGAIANTRLDSLFIVAYSLFLFAAVYRTGDQLKGPVSNLKYVAWLAPIAGLLDFLENYKMLQFMKNTDNFHSAHFVSFSKWGLIVFLLALFIVLSCRLVDLGKLRIKN